MCEGIWQPELRGDLGAPPARSEQPDVRGSRHFRRDFDSAERMFWWKIVVKECQQFRQLFGEV